MTVIGEYKKITDFPIRQSGVGRITEVSDPDGSGKTVLRLELHKEDGSPVTPTVNPRCQLDTPFIFKTGNTYYAKHRCYIPSVANGGPLPELSTKFLSIFQIFGYPYEGSPPVSLKLSDEEGKGVKNRLLWQRNSSYAFDKPLTREFTTDGWHTILYGFKHATEANGGYVELWIDGVQQTFDFAGYNPNGHASTTKLVMDTVDPGVNDNDAKEGGNTYVLHLYKKEGTWEPLHVYFDGAVVTTTKAEAEAGLGGEGGGVAVTHTMNVAMPVAVTPKVVFNTTHAMNVQMPISVAPKVKLLREGAPVEEEKAEEKAEEIAVAHPHRQQLTVPKLKVPLEMGVGGFEVVEQDTVEEIAQCVYAIVNTPAGSRIDDVEFGVEDHAFDQLPIEEQDWLDAIARQEPRARVRTTQEIDQLVDNVTIEVSST